MSALPPFFRRRSANGRYLDAPRGPSLFARKGEAAPIIDRSAGALAPEDIVRLNDTHRRTGRRLPGPRPKASSPPVSAAVATKPPPPFATAAPAVPIAVPIAAPKPPPARTTEPHRIAVSFRMSVREFLRLKIGAAALGRRERDVLVAAIDVYLDAVGVERLDAAATPEREDMPPVNPRDDPRHQTRRRPLT